MGAPEQTADAALPLQGGCMCGACRFSISEPLVGAGICHCTRCQKRTGSAVSVTALTQKGSFSWTAGEEHVREWDPGDGGFVKAFCEICGSQLYAASAADPTILAVRMGTIDGDPGVRPGAHQFTRYAAVWEQIPDDGLPRFPERLGVGEPEA